MTNLFYAPKLLCLDPLLPALLWSGDCQNETTGWEITPSRFVRPRCSSSPSFFSWFPRSLAAARRERGGGDFKPGKYCLKKPCSLLLDLCLFLRSCSLYQISSEGLGDMEDGPLNQLKMAFTCFCNTWRTHFGHWMSSLGSALQRRQWRELRQVSMLMLSPRKDATRCYPTSKEAIYIQNQQTLAICWAIFKSLSLPKPSHKKKKKLNLWIPN